MEQLLTKTDLAKHWQVSERTIDQYRKDGIVSACNLPVVRFSPQHIAGLDGVKLEKFSPLERRRLEKELEYWKTRALKLEEAFNRMDILISETRYLKQKEELGGKAI